MNGFFLNFLSIANVNYDFDKKFFVRATLLNMFTCQKVLCDIYKFAIAFLKKWYYAYLPKVIFRIYLVYA